MSLSFQLLVFVLMESSALLAAAPGMAELYEELGNMDNLWGKIRKQRVAN